MYSSFSSPDVFTHNFSHSHSSCSSLTDSGPLHHRPIVGPGEDGGVVVDVRHLDDKVSGVLDQLPVAVVHPGRQVVGVLLLAVQRSGDKQVAFVVHREDGVGSFTVNFKILHLQPLARFQLGMEGAGG